MRQPERLPADKRISAETAVPERPAKAVIGPKLKARHYDNQKTEAKIGVHVLNRMTELGRPQFTRVANAGVGLSRPQC